VVVAIAIGRTDRDRVHRTLSFTLWPALIATALVGLAVAHWGIQ
jgi:Na+-driven multidrug efflux pump